jgi:hypothetical protein
VRALLACCDAGSGARRSIWDRIFFRKISVVRAGGFLVFEPNFHLWREKLRWEGLLFYFGLIAALGVLSSCGSSPTTVAPTISASCVPTDVTVLGTSQCTATILNNTTNSTLVNWSISGTGNGSINTTSGLYTAPAAVPTNNVVTITATSQALSTLTATTSVTLVAATAITAVICNDSAGNQASIVSSMSTLACTAFASVATSTTVPVNWSVTNTKNPGVTTNIGSISKQGIYTAALVPPPGQAITITATSQALATETMSVSATVVFGNAVLSGPYVFSTSGRVKNLSNAFWARAGSFTAGGGALVGIEDTNQGGSPNSVDNTATAGAIPVRRNFTGSYSIGPDGRGAMQFCEDTSAACPQGGPASSYFRIVVISPNQARIVEFSSPTVTSATTTAGGEILSQDPLVSPNNNENLSGTYSFNFAGVSTTATEESVAGDFAANGFGSISLGSSSSPGEMDINAGGPVALAATTYSISSNGRGTVTLNGLNFSFYPVSASRAKFIEIDTASLATPTTPASILVGDAYRQQTSSTCGWGLNALSGSTVLETSGASTGVAIADVGAFTASNGVVSTASIDENSGGTVSSAVGTLSGSYTMDPCGRGTLAIGSHSYVYYIVSASEAVLQETTSGVIAHGLLVPSQGGPFADATLTGSYAFQLAGTDAAGAAGQREDFLGQLTSTGSGAGLAGNLDLNDFGATQTGCVPLTTNCVAITNGTYLPIPAGTLRGTMALPLSTTPASTRNLVLYMVSPTLFYALDVDPSPAGTAIGAIYNQF